MDWLKGFGIPAGLGALLLVIIFYMIRENVRLDERIKVLESQKNTFKSEDLEMPKEDKESEKGDIGLARRLLLLRLQKLPLLQKVVEASKQENPQNSKKETLPDSQSEKFSDVMNSEALQKHIVGVQQSIQKTNLEIKEIRSTIEHELTSLKSYASQMDNNYRDKSHNEAVKQMKTAYPSELKNLDDEKLKKQIENLEKHRTDLVKNIKDSENKILNDYNNYANVRERALWQENEFYDLEMIAVILKATINDNPPNPKAEN